MSIGRVPGATGIQPSIVDAKGDLIVATAADSVDRLAVGTNEQRLVADSAVATGLKYVADTTNYAIAAKGDLLVGTSADTLAALTVGANNTVLTVDSSTATGLKWATPAGGGKVLQVVNAIYSTTVTNATTTWADTGLSASITPSATSSKVLILVSQNGCFRNATGNTTGLYLRQLRGGTELQQIALDWGYTNLNQIFLGGSISACYLDSPSTTSSTTYKTQFRCGTGLTSTSVQESGSTSYITLMEIGA